MTKTKAIAEFNNTYKIIEKKYEALNLMKFFLDGGRISIKKQDLGKKFDHINDGDYPEIFNDNFLYILEYGLINSTISLEEGLKYGMTKEEWQKTYDKNFETQLYTLHMPYSLFQMDIGKKSYYDIETICEYLCQNEIPFEKLNVQKHLETKYKEEYKDKQVYIPKYDIYANIINTFLLNDELIFAVEGYNGNFTIKKDEVEIQDQKLDLENFEKNNDLDLN